MKFVEVVRLVLISIKGANAAVRSQEILTVGMVGAEAKFSFSGDMWDGLGKVAVFRQGNVTKDAILANDAAVIPWEVLQLPGIPVSIGVYGAREDGSVVIPTVWAKTNPVQPAADPSGDESFPPTPSLGEQAVALANIARDDAAAARQTMESVEQRANNGEFIGKKGDPGYTPVKGKDYFDGKDGVSVSVQSVSESAEDGGSNIVTFSDGKKLNVKNGRKGDPGYTPQKGVDYFDGKDGTMIFADLTEEQKASLKGDPGYTPVKGVDYFDGKDGTSVTVSSVTETNEYGGSNVVTFSDGKQLTVKNGGKGDPGYTPQKGVDYFDGKDADPYTLTEADKNAIAEAVKASLKTKTWTFTLEDGYTVAETVYVGVRKAITFYFDADDVAGGPYTPYQAEEGMTWAEFVDSSYNPDESTYYRFCISEVGYMMSLNGMVGLYYNGNIVRATDVIIPDGIYTYKQG